MGFLDIFKARTDATVMVAATPVNGLLPGAHVELRAEVGGELDDKVEALQLGIRCTNTYEHWTRDSDGDRHRSTSTDTVWESAQDLPASLGSHEVAIDLPSDALPTVDGKLDWIAFARLARKRARDVSEEQPLTVLSPGDRYAGVEELPPTASGGGATSRFEGLTRRARPGDKVSGVLIVSPDEEGKTTARVNLTRLRVDSAAVYDWGAGRVGEIGGVALSYTFGKLDFYDANSTIKDQFYADNLRFDELELVAGQEAKFPFTLTVPPTAEPTVAGPHTAVHWRIEAVLERRFKHDIEVGVELNVYNAPAA